MALAALKAGMSDSPRVGVASALQRAADNSTRVMGEATPARHPQARDHGGALQRVFAPGEGVDDKTLRPGTADFTTQMEWLKSQAGPGSSIMGWRFGKQSTCWDRYTAMLHRLSIHDREEAADAVLAISHRFATEAAAMESEIHGLAGRCAQHGLIRLDGGIESLPAQLGINLTQKANFSADQLARQNLFRVITTKLREKLSAHSAASTAGGSASATAGTLGAIAGSRQAGLATEQGSQRPRIRPREVLGAALQSANQSLQQDFASIRRRIRAAVDAAVGSMVITQQEAQQIGGFPPLADVGGSRLLDTDVELRALLIEASELTETASAPEIVNLVQAVMDSLRMKAANLLRESDVEDFIAQKRAQRQNQVILKPPALSNPAAAAAHSSNTEDWL